MLLYHIIDLDSIHVIPTYPWNWRKCIPARVYKEVIRFLYKKYTFWIQQGCFLILNKMSTTYPLHDIIKIYLVQPWTQVKIIMNCIEFSWPFPQHFSFFLYITRFYGQYSCHTSTQTFPDLFLFSFSFVLVQITLPSCWLASVNLV